MKTPKLKLNLHGWPDVPLTPEQVAANAREVAAYLMALKLQRQAIAKLGGQATAGLSTAKKRKSSAENGKKGGRPRKEKKNAPTTALTITTKGRPA